MIRPDSAIRQFDSVLQAVLDAGVPEVIAFRWPIRDVESRRFAERFYDHYLDRFDASLAAFQAGKAFEDSATIWPAPVVFRPAE